MQITFKDFEKHLKDVTTIMKLQDDISSLSYDYNKMKCDEFQLWFPSLIDNVISLLANLTNDTEEWIEYWVYELGCGERADNYDITDKDGNPIPLSSIEDLWNLLNESESANDIKQIPIAAHKGKYSYYCPTCGKCIDGWIDGNFGIYVNRNKYCSECGQKLKWNDANKNTNTFKDDKRSLI